MFVVRRRSVCTRAVGVLSRAVDLTFGRLPGLTHPLRRVGLSTMRPRVKRAALCMQHARRVGARSPPAPQPAPVVSSIVEIYTIGARGRGSEHAACSEPGPTPDGQRSVLAAPSVACTEIHSFSRPFLHVTHVQQVTWF